MSGLAIRPVSECRYDAIALGEVMLRLDPGEGRIRTARSFSAWEGGGEYNVARGLHKCFGLRTGIVTALADNIANNLPVGLIAGSVVANDHLPASVTGAMLIGVDLGPNLSITGSLATILWLVALRREKIEVNALRFLGVGLIVMPPALIASLLILR